MAGKKEFKLDISSINEARDFVGNLIGKYKCTERDRILAQLFVEETFLYWSPKLGAQDSVHINVHKRFKTISLTLSCPGIQANPLVLDDNADAEFDFIGQNILIGLSKISYSYENGHNTITYTIKEKPVNPVLAIAIALAGAALSGVAVNNLAPAVSSCLSKTVLTPLSNAFFGLLNAVVIPFLFISVVASIFNMENIAQMKRVFRILFSWFMGLTVMAAVISGMAGIVFFPVQNGSYTGGGDDVWAQIAKMGFDIIPSNMFQSFLSGNTLQIIFLAVIIGIAMLTLKGRFPVVTDAITECNLILSTLLDAICSLMPWVIYICIFNMLLSRQGGALLGTLNVVVIICACFLLFIMFCLLSIVLIEKENPLGYMKKIGPVLLLALSTASSSTTFAPHTMTAINKQGIRDYLAKFSIPVGALFCKPFVVPVLFIMALFAGKFYMISFSMADILSMLVLCIILSVAVPPTQGMGTFLFTIVFNRYGVPLEGLAMAATIFMLFDYFMTTGNVFSINISMVHTEYRLKQFAGQTGLSRSACL